MKRKLKPLGELEQKVMNVVWSEGCATVRCVCDTICQERDIAYTTVMTTMDRLTKKKLLKRVKVGKAYEYQATKSREELNASMSQEIIDSLLANYGEVAIAQFLNAVDDINPQDLKALQEKYSN